MPLKWFLGSTATLPATNSPTGSHRFEDVSCADAYLNVCPFIRAAQFEVAEFLCRRWSIR